MPNCEVFNCEEVVNQLETNQIELFQRTDDLRLAFNDVYRIQNVVYTQEEFFAALLLGGTIVFGALIPITTGGNISVNGTRLTALSKSFGLAFQHHAAPGAVSGILSINAKNVTLGNFTIDGGHPLTSDTTTKRFGLLLNSDSVTDISGLTIRDVEITNVFAGIGRYGNTSTKTFRDGLFDNLNINGFVGSSVDGSGGILLQWRTKNLKCSKLTVRGRNVGQSHAVPGNALWIGNYCDSMKMESSSISQVDRHAVEFWNSQKDPANYNGNMNGTFNDNIIEDIGGFAFTCFGAGAISVNGNVVNGCAIGIEMYNDPVNLATLIAVGNIVKNASSQAVSLNGCIKATVKTNEFEDIPSNHAVQLINGGRDIDISDNTFRNAGRWSVLINGKRLTITNIQTGVANALITCSARINPMDGNPGVDDPDPNSNKWYPGKRIYIRDVVGTTEANNRYYTIISVSNNQMLVGMDSTGYTPYVSGGVIQEEWKNIAVTNNKFYLYNHINNGGASTYSFYGYDYQSVSLQDNTQFYNATVPSLGGFVGANLATTYIDKSGTPILTSGFSSFAGTNFSIPFNP